MKTIELTDKAYADLLEYKNIISFKVHAKSTGLKNYPKNTTKKLMRTENIEPEFGFSECVSLAIGYIWYTQETGEVSYIN